MASSISWLDFDNAARDQSQQLLAMFNEPDTRDELGLGSIRDALADLLFPGTSTIQTRLKYMLLVPWVYAKLESDRVPGHQFGQRAREMELQLTKVLDRPGETGIIGSAAKDSLQRLPSSIYWAGLGAWGIRLFNGSQAYYHQSIDLVHRRRKARERSRERGEPDAEVHDAQTWHEFLYDKDRLKQSLDSQAIALTYDEADFLQERILASQPRSYLAWLARRNEPDHSGFPWTHARTGEVPADIAELLHHARLFSHLMHGASLLYNFLLAQYTERQEKREQYEERITNWRESAPWDELSQWQLDAFFGVARNTSHRIWPSAEDFVRSWHRHACHSRGDVLANNQAAQLIRNRERSLKRTKSRFDNASTRARWSGESGTAQFSYRWDTVKTFMQDLHAGLNS